MKQMWMNAQAPHVRMKEHVQMEIIPTDVIAYLDILELLVRQILMNV